MNVLYIVSLFPCWSETFIVREMHSLKKKGVDLSIFSLKKAGEEIVQSDTEDLSLNTIYPQSIIILSFYALIQFIKKPLTNTRMLICIVLALYNKPQSMFKSIATWWITLSVIRKIKQLKIDHIHAHWATYPSTSALIIHKNTNIPFSFTSHAHDIFLEDHMLYQKVKDSAFSVTISNYNKNRLSKQLKLDLSNKMNIVHCAIDVNDHVFKPTDRDARTILAVGRLDHIKGFSVLIDACKKYKDSGGKFDCIIIGNGPLKDQLQNQIDNNNLSNYVKLVGVMPQEKIKEYLSRATLFVLPSVVTDKGDMDGIPVALMEAMAVGVPVISTTVSGIPELIHNESNGLVVSPNDSSALADAIDKLINDTNLINKYTLAARRSIEEEFSIKIEVEKLYSLLLRSVQSSSDVK